MSDQSSENTPADNAPAEGPAFEMPPLTDFERHVILDKGTEMAESGQYWQHFETGTYICRQCGAPLYESDTKFDSHCGWPSFDDEIPGAVERKPDANGRRTEILCTACGGHLGHVFLGEQITEKNTRHCVNSTSIVFVPATPAEPAAEPATQTAIFAGGCFWGVEHYFQQADGVISAVSGYTAGEVDDPTYRQVSNEQTGHAEAVQVTFDPALTSYEQLAKLFFEIHDPTQLDRQGPDVGDQYRSAVFYLDDQQKLAAEKLIAQLQELGYDVVTLVQPAQHFWPAEEYHQDYIQKNPTRKCHAKVLRFDTPAEQ